MKGLFKGLLKGLPLCLGLLLPFTLQAQDGMAKGERLAKVSRCYSCHDMSKTLIGPPYRAIAARHAAQKDVMVDVLADKIILGGGGNWGVVPMVPNEHVSKEDARTIARWILSLADN